MSKIKNLADLTELPWVEQDIADGSITPRTLVERDFATLKSSSVFTPKGGEFYVERYEHRDSSGTLKSTTLHFGINVHNPTIKSLITLPTPSVSGAASVVSSGSKKPQQLEIEAKAFSTKYITKQEQYLCEEVINYLNTTSALTVVVDIFARNSDGSTKTEQKKDPTTPTLIQIVPEVHSVTLYKQPSSSGTGNEFLVIDPSNSAFSYVLAAAHSCIRLCFAPEPIQIHKSIDKPGPDGWRDCVDIAVKLAFCFEKNKDVIIVENGMIAQKSLESAPSVKDVTNQQKLDKHFLKAFEPYPFRACGSSDIVQIGTTKFLLHKAVALLLKIKEKTEETTTQGFYHLKARIDQKYDLKKPVSIQDKDHSKCITELSKICQALEDITQEMSNPKFLEVQELSLIGDNAGLHHLLQLP